MRTGSLVVAFVCTAAVALASHSKPCKYWCKSHDEHAYYCCPSGKTETRMAEAMWPIISSPIFWIGVIGTSIGMHSHKSHSHVEPPARKKMRCPPTRWSCPRSSEWYDPPSHCDHDEECPHEEMCCYDICLEHRVCKPAE